jgi:hypothetical protein
MKHTTSALLLLILCLSTAANAAADGNRVVAMGDVHGRYEQLVTLLDKTRLVDEQNRWAGGDARLVIAGDAVDRGPSSRRVLDLLMQLERQAREAGGRVYVLLGNHEVMWLTGDFEYTSKNDFAAFAGDETAEMREGARERFDKLKAAGRVKGSFEERFPPGSLAMRQALSPDGEYGEWLMERPVSVVVGDTAFVHGGISEDYAGATAEALNDRAKREMRELLEAWQILADAGIVAPEYPMLNAARGLEAQVEQGLPRRLPRRVRKAAETLAGAFDSMLFDEAGPLWYRGNAECNPLVERAVLDKALAGLGATSLVISHTPVEDSRVTARMEGGLVRIDTGERGAALEITPGNRRVFYADEEEPQAPAYDDDYPVADQSMSREAIEDFLAEAEVVGMEDVGTGVTNPKRVTLERNGMRMRAVFKTETTPTRSTGRLNARRIANLADRHAHDLGAYRLDRLLDLGMVPPAVERRIGRTTGTLQYWVENAINERTRRKQDLEPKGACPLNKEYVLLELFDRLIYNTDRTQENILYRPDWHVALIDHTRAFRTHSGMPENVRSVSITEAPGFAERLERLDRETLKSALGDVLEDGQLRAVLGRRDEMLAEWQKESAGEVAAR